MPGVVFAVVSITTGIMALLLPETLNRPLPDTIEEIEGWTRALPPELRSGAANRETKRKSCDQRKSHDQEAVNVIRDVNTSPVKDETNV